MNVILGQTIWTPKARIPQQTFEEAAIVAMALAHGPYKGSWQSDRNGLLWTSPSRRHRVLLDGKSIGAIKIDDSVKRLFGVLSCTGIRAAILLSVAVHIARTTPIQAIAIDNIITAIGIRPQSENERLGWRQWVTQTLGIISAMRVNGKRRTSYYCNHKVVDTSIDCCLIGVETIPENAGEVVIHPTYWLEKHQPNASILPYSGDIRPIARIPAGKPGGALAQSIGLALNQIWREDARKPGGGSLTTREELIGMYPSEPKHNPYTVLDGYHPLRAQQRFERAIMLLQKAGVVGGIEEEFSLPDCRQGWKDAWLKQPLNITPGEETARVLRDIGQRANTHTQRSEARRRKAA